MTTPIPSKVRKNVTLTPEDLDDVSALKTHGSPEQAALRTLTGIDLGDRPSEAETMRAIFTAGRLAIKEQMFENSCRQAGRADQQDPERQQWRRARSGRHSNVFGESE